MSLAKVIYLKIPQIDINKHKRFDQDGHLQYVK